MRNVNSMRSIVRSIENARMISLFIHTFFPAERKNNAGHQQTYKNLLFTGMQLDISLIS